MCGKDTSFTNYLYVLINLYVLNNGSFTFLGDIIFTCTLIKYCCLYKIKILIQGLRKLKRHR